MLGLVVLLGGEDYGFHSKGVTIVIKEAVGDTLIFLKAHELFGRSLR